eukprot:scaffold111508_cov20-Tisochrysis_lutea.AAC.1
MGQLHPNCPPSNDACKVVHWGNASLSTLPCILKFIWAGCKPGQYQLVYYTLHTYLFGRVANQGKISLDNHPAASFCAQVVNQDNISLSTMDTGQLLDLFGKQAPPSAGEAGAAAAGAQPPKPAKATATSLQVRLAQMVLQGQRALSLPNPAKATGEHVCVSNEALGAEGAAGDEVGMGVRRCQISEGALIAGCIPLNDLHTGRPFRNTVEVTRRLCAALHQAASFACTAGLEAMLAGMGELWDEKEYEQQFDMQSFMEKVGRGAVLGRMTHQSRAKDHTVQNWHAFRIDPLG